MRYEFSSIVSEKNSLSYKISKFKYVLLHNLKICVLVCIKHICTTFHYIEGMNLYTFINIHSVKSLTSDHGGTTDYI